VSDPDKGDILTATVTSSNEELLSGNAVDVTETEGTWSLTVIPVDNAIGETTITVTVSDGTVEVKESFLLTVEPPPIHTVTLTQPRGGTLTIEPDGTEYEEGVIVRLTVTPADGYEFLNWTGSIDSIENPIVLPVDKALEVGALLQDIAPPLITISSPTPGPVVDQVLSIAGQVTDNDQLASYQWYRGDKLEGSLNPNASGYFTIGGLELKEGKNPFKITAKDASGNEAAEEFVVNWSASTLLTVLDSNTTVEGKIISFPVMLKSGGEVGGITFKLAYNPTFLGEPVFEWSGLLSTQTPRAWWWPRSLSRDRPCPRVSSRSAHSSCGCAACRSAWRHSSSPRSSRSPTPWATRLRAAWLRRSALPGSTRAASRAT